MREAAQEQTEKGFLRSLFLASAGGIASCAAISAGVDPVDLGSPMMVVSLAASMAGLVCPCMNFCRNGRMSGMFLSFAAGSWMASGAQTPPAVALSLSIVGSLAALDAAWLLGDRYMNSMNKKVLAGAFTGMALGMTLALAAAAGVAGNSNKDVPGENGAAHAPVKALSHEQKKPSPGSFDMGREPDYMPH